MSPPRRSAPPPAEIPGGDRPIEAFAQTGHALHRGVAYPALARLEDVAANRDVRAGRRLRRLDEPIDLLHASGPIGAVAAWALGPRARPVRAVLLDKSAASNWALGWHQDRTIVVRARIDTPGFGPWTVKAGLHHVAPPWDVLGQMVTVRIHIDPVDADNGPLLVAPGSHRLGPIAEDWVDAIVRDCGSTACLAAAGDVWLYATPILHASARAARPRRRRVLQLDYAARDLPGGLSWSGISSDR